MQEDYPSSRNWCFTYFFYVIEDIDYFLSIPCRGIIFQEEMCPKTQTPHLQGFIRFARAYNIHEVKRMFTQEMQHIHLESSVSPIDAINYCRKGETRMGVCYEEGDLVFKQGKSSSLLAAYELIQSGTTLSNLVRTFPVECIRHVRGLTFVRATLAAESDVRFRTVTCFAIYGHSGAGKTRASYGYDAGLYKLDRSASNGNIWFDGYDGQQTLLIDDFYGWIPYGQLLNILDGYPLRLDVKGGHTRALWTTVILTSNTSPDLWYPHLFPGGCSPALRRRLHGCLCVRSDATADSILEFFRRDHTTGAYRLPERVTATDPLFLTVADARRYRLESIEGNMY